MGARRSSAVAVLLCFLSGFCIAQQLSPAPLITQPIAEAQLTTLKGNTHPLALPQFDVGAAAPDMPLSRMLLVLKRSPEQEFALRTLLDNQQDKASPSYHKWLTPEDFGAQFGPADSDMQLVTGWLQTHGFQINRVSHGRTVIEFSGTEGQVEAAFHTSIHKYRVNGEEHWANASDPQIPTALAPAIAGLASLNNFPRKPLSILLGTYSPKTRSVTPVNSQFTFGSGNCFQNTCYAVGPADFGAIYNVQTLWNSGIDGTGQTIAIVAESDINLQDIRDFRTLFGLPAKDPNVIYDGPNPGPQPDESEADIDAEWSGAIAPNATVDFVVSQSTETSFGVDLSAVYIIDNNLAPVMSESYGICELGLGTSGNQFYNTLWAQAAAQGITVILASGDSGSNGCTEGVAQFGLNVSGYASTPFNTAIGGTDFNDLLNPIQYWNSNNASATQESAKGYIPETTWNLSCTNSVLLVDLNWPNTPEANCNNSQLIQAGLVESVGGSGGKSNCTTNAQQLGTCSGGYTKPSWQVGQGVPSDGKRDIPDVSFFASNGVLNNFYVYCQSDAFANCAIAQYGAAGGTSFGAPIFAGVMALINQKMSTPEGQGIANYVLYKLASQQTASSCNSSTGPGASCVFNDVTSGTIAMPCIAGTPNCTVQTAGHQYGILSGYNTTTGYDLATGLGSVNVGNLVTKWNSVTFRPTTTTLSLSPTSSLTHGQAVTVTGSVAPSSGTGTPSGKVALLTSTGLGVDGFTLTNGALSGTTNLLPGGTYTVTAHYGGDPTFGGSDSTPVSVTVGPENSKVFVDLETFDNNGVPTSLNASGATYGNGFYLLRVDVGDSAATVSSSSGVSSKCSNGSASCPTGTLAITNNGSPLGGGSFPLNVAGYTEDQSLPTGAYAVSVSYPGDSSYNASTGAGNFTINKAPTTVSAGVAGLPVEYGNAEEIAAGIQTNSNGAAPTGTFSMSIDGAPATLVFGGLVYEGFPGTPTNPATLTASGSTVFLSLGSHTISAQYSGDNNYAASSSSTSSVTVVPANTFFNGEGALPSQAAWQQSVTLTATLFGSEFGVAPSGTITFLDNGTPVSGTVTYVPKPASPNVGSTLQANLAYTPATPGTHNITATYSGDANYSAASTVLPATLTVAGPFSITPAGTVMVSGPGQTGSTTLTITPVTGFNGTVTLTCAPDANAKEAACSFANGSSTSPSVQVTLNGASATATLNVTTTAPHTALNKWLPGGPLSGLIFASFLVFPFARTKMRVLWSLLLAAALLSLAACGAGGSNGSGGGGGGGRNTDPGTAAGNYSFTVTGVSGSGNSAITVASTVAVSVQ